MTQRGLWSDDRELPIIGNHGQKAAKAGRGWEMMVAQCARNYNLRVKDQVQTDWSSIMGEQPKIDHIVYGLQGYQDGLAVEVKYQNASGSIEKKIYYLVHNILKHYRLPCVIVWGGTAREIAKAMTWAKTQVDGNRLIGVFTMDEWFAWLEQRLSG